MAPAPRRIGRGTPESTEDDLIILRLATELVNSFLVEKEPEAKPGLKLMRQSATDEAAPARPAVLLRNRGEAAPASTQEVQSPAAGQPFMPSD